MRRLKSDAVDLVITTPEGALRLLSRSALSVDAIAALVLAWPEGWADEDAITPLMQDLPKETQRVIYTATADRVDAFVVRLLQELRAWIRAPPGRSGRSVLRGRAEWPLWLKWWRCWIQLPW
jgi:hypothetical protein